MVFQCPILLCPSFCTLLLTSLVVVSSVPPQPPNTTTTTTTTPSQYHSQWNDFRTFALKQPCGIQQYDSVLQAEAAVQAQGQHAWVVRGLEDARALENEFQAPTLVQTYGDRSNHFSRIVGKQETVSAAWQQMVHFCRTKNGTACIEYALTNGAASNTFENQLRNDQHHKPHGMVGVVLHKEEQHRFNAIVKDTAGLEDANSHMGMIFGNRGNGVYNDLHLPVYFYHLSGLKGWLFSEKALQQNKNGLKRGEFCEPGLFSNTASNASCLLGPGDLLYAPSTLYHSTCHLDDNTVTMIQYGLPALGKGGAELSAVPPSDDL